MDSALNMQNRQPQERNKCTDEHLFSYGNIRLTLITQNMARAPAVRISSWTVLNLIHKNISQSSKILTEFETHPSPKASNSKESLSAFTWTKPFIPEGKAGGLEIT
jgi:hypothetical protein